MKQFRKQLPGLCLVLAAAIVLCLSLNRWDNKYTRPDTQAIDGILVLSKEELENTDLHYLINGWAFYPDLLLTPETLADSQNQYMIYTSIGEHTRFDTGSTRDPYGCGTYALTLVLPETPGRYALELPEVYSAYKLYLNDDLILQMGDPQKESYCSLTQKRVVTFEAHGAVTILLAVSNYSHFYGGLVYPPAFGSAHALDLMRGTRMGLTLCLALAALITALLSCYMGIRMHHKNSLLFAFLCLTAALCSVYSLLHCAFALPVHPWYALELFSGYAITWMVLILQNRICSIKTVPSRISAVTAGLFCILSLCYGLFSSCLTIPVIESFSMLSAIFKWGSAAYLLAVSCRALYLETIHSPALFYGSAFYSAMLILDRLIPDFEPVLSGWFTEWGSFILILVIGGNLWHELVAAYAYSVTFAEEHHQMERQLAMQIEYSDQLKERAKENRRLVHDFRQHLRTVTELAAQVDSIPETEPAQKYLLDYLQQLPKQLFPKTNVSAGAFSNHTAVDALLQYYTAAARRQEVQPQFLLSIPDGIPLSDVEWCSVLGNLLENALEACQRQKTGSRMAAILTAQTPGTLFLKVENSYDGQCKQLGMYFLSRKSGDVRLGVGLESVRKIITQHGGTMDVCPGEEIFSVRITLPIMACNQQY